MCVCGVCVCVRVCSAYVACAPVLLCRVRVGGGVSPGNEKRKKPGLPKNVKPICVRAGVHVCACVSSVRVLRTPRPPPLVRAVLLLHVDVLAQSEAMTPPCYVTAACGSASGESRPGGLEDGAM